MVPARPGGRLGRLVGVALVLSIVPFSASPSQATRGGILTGTVTDSVGSPIFDAAIEIEGSRYRTGTDESGAFRFTGLSAGPVVVRARRLGFAPATVAAQVADVGSANVLLRLSPLAMPLPPVVVRLGKMEYSGRLSGYYQRLERRTGGYFITRDEIDRQNPRTLSQLLQHVPGISPFRGRGGVSGIRMRGRTCWPLVWLDGTPMPAGEVDLDSFAPSSIHGIELYLGSTTAPLKYTYSTDVSSCGTILLWSRGADTDPIVDNPKPRWDIASMVASLSVYTADQVDRRAALDAKRPLDVRYPPSLFAARVKGLVIAEFVVDTLGRVEDGTIGIVSSTNALFSEGVRVALAQATYVPALRQGRAVRQLVQQPFDFDTGERRNR